MENSGKRNYQFFAAVRPFEVCLILFCLCFAACSELETPKSEPFYAETAPPPASAAPPTRFVFAGWQLDTVARGLTNAQGQEVALTGGEFDLLCIFVQRPGRVLSRDLLLAQTRRRDAAPFDRTIDVQVGRLRKKLEADAQDPRIIKSVRGAGYILVPPVSGG